MTSKSTKAELLADIRVQRKRLEKALASLSREEMTRAGVVGEWSVKDVLAHLAAWEQVFLNWYESGYHGKIPDSMPVGMSARAIDALNQQIYNQFRENTLDDVLIRFEDSFQQILSQVEAITEEELFTPGQYEWTDRWTLADYIAGNTNHHYLWAKNKIRDWMRSNKKM